MSYDLHLYRCELGTPDAAEAIALQEAEEGASDAPADATAIARAERLVAALLAVDPQLERFMPPEGLVRLPIQLDTPEGDRAALQISIFSDGVTVSIANGHGPKRARRIFARFDRCARAVHEAEGYFVFDPQCESAWDPSQQDADPGTAYLPMQPIIGRSLAASAVPRETSDDGSAVDEARERLAKPWWKFW